MAADLDQNDGEKSLDPETLKAPESRVGSAASVRERVAELRKNDQTRAGRRAIIQGNIDGNKPFSAAKLRNKGQADRTNLNTREAEGMADAAKTPFYPLVFRTNRFLNLETSFGDNAQRKAEWSDRISQEIHQTIADWQEHDFNAQIRDWQMCVFGVGIPMWMDSRDWRWEAMKVSDFLVPDRAPANIKKLPEAAVPRRLNPVDLYKMVEKEASAKTMGWFPERVKKAIVNRASDSMKTQWGDGWSEGYQSALRRGDVQWNGKDREVPIVHYFIKEFSGKITHVILLDDGGMNSGDDKADDGLLYKKEGRYDCFSNVANPFFFDVGQGEWHSIKGLGPKIHDFCDLSNRFTSGMVDSAKRGMAQLFRAKDANAFKTEQQPIDIGGAVVLPPDYEVQQNRVGTDLQGPLAVKRDLQNTLQSNTGQYRQRPSAENQEPTLGQAQLNYQNQGQLSDAAVDRFMNALDRLYLEMVRRMLNPRLTEKDPGGKEALAMRKRCEEAGVPKEALLFENVRSVKAVRGIGNGSPVSSEIASRSLLELLPMMDERGRRNALRTRTAQLVGQGNVDQFFPPFDEASVPDDHVWAATLENMVIDLGGDVSHLLTDKQDHVTHFKVHYGGQMENVQALQQGQADPIQVLKGLHSAGPHMRAHLDKIKGDPTRKAQLAPMEEAWLAMSKIADQLQQQVEEHLRSEAANPPQPQVDPDLVAAMAKVQGDLEIKRMKAVGDHQIKAEKQRASDHLKDLQAAAEIRRKNAVAAAGVQTDALTSAASAAQPEAVTA